MQHQVSLCQASVRASVRRAAMHEVQLGGRGWKCRATGRAGRGRGRGDVEGKGWRCDLGELSE